MAEETTTTETTTTTAAAAGDGTAATAATTAATTAAAATEGAGTTAATAATTAAATETAPAWPDDWRTKLAGGDEKLVKRLERFTGPDAIMKSWLSLEQRLSSGEIKAVLPKNATPEQIADWRKENGIPADPTEYVKGLPEGLVIGDADKPMVDDFFAKAHKLNVPPAAAGEILGLYYKNSEAQAQKQAEADGQFVREAEDALRSKYSGDYRVNMTGLENLFGRQRDGKIAGSMYMPPGVAAALANARTAEGKPLLADPAAIDWFVTMSREVFPDIFRTLAPATGAANGVSTEARIAEITKVMREKPSDYFKNPAMQAELLALNQRREREQKRA